MFIREDFPGNNASEPGLKEKEKISPRMGKDKSVIGKGSDLDKEPRERKIIIFVKLQVI